MAAKARTKQTRQVVWSNGTDKDTSEKELKDDSGEEENGEGNFDGVNVETNQD